MTETKSASAPEIWLFDCDNTLYPKRAGVGALIVAATHKVCQESFGISAQDCDALYQQHGSTIEGLRITRKLQCDAVAELYRKVYELVDVSGLKPNGSLKKLLQSVPHPLHVVSNSPEFFVRKVLTQLELIDCFKSIITPCKSNAWIAKPSAAWFSFITSAFSSHALSELVVFEDMKETVVECGKRGVRAHLINCEHTVEHAIRLQLATPRRPIAFQYLEFTKPLAVSVRESTLCAAKAKQESKGSDAAAAAEFADLGDNELLVLTHCSAISAGTELKVFSGKLEQPGDEGDDGGEIKADTTIASLADSMGYPMRYGYCTVGTVARCGRLCSPAVCAGTRVFSFQPHGSAFVAREQDVMVIPDGISFEDAVFLPSVETAVSMVHDAAPRLGERLAVLGQGIIGLLITAILSRGSFVDFTAIDLAPKRLEKAKQITGSKEAHICTGFAPAAAPAAAASSAGAGAAATPAAPAAKAKSCAVCRDFDVCIEVTGHPRALQTALNKTRYGGKVVVGSWYGTAPVQLTLGTTIHRSHIELVFSQVSNISASLSDRWSKARRIQTVWQLIRELKPSASLVSHRVALSAAQDTYSRLLTSPNEFLQVLFQYERA